MIGVKVNVMQRAATEEYVSAYTLWSAVSRLHDAELSEIKQPI